MDRLLAFPEVHALTRAHADPVTRQLFKEQALESALEALTSSERRRVHHLVPYMMDASHTHGHMVRTLLEGPRGEALAHVIMYHPAAHFDDAALVVHSLQALLGAHGALTLALTAHSSLGDAAAQRVISRALGGADSLRLGRAVLFLSGVDDLDLVDTLLHVALVVPRGPLALEYLTQVLELGAAPLSTPLDAAGHEVLRTLFSDASMRYPTEMFKVARALA